MKMANVTYTKPQTARMTLHKMILEALKQNKVSKGCSMQAIKRYITDTYPETKDNLSSGRFRRALDKGLLAGEILRTKNTEADGFRARFVLNRPHIKELEQQKKATRKTTDDKKTKAVKPRSASKSPGRKVTKPKSSKSTSKSPARKSSKATAKRSVSKSPGRKSKLLKSPKTKQKIPARSPKVKKASAGPAKLMKKAKTSTPKLTKSRKAGTGVKTGISKRAPTF